MKPRNSNGWGSLLQVKADHKIHSMSEGLVRFPALAEEGQGPLQPGVSPWAAGSHPRGPAENSAVICVLPVSMWSKGNALWEGNLKSSVLELQTQSCGFGFSYKNQKNKYTLFICRCRNHRIAL